MAQNVGKKFEANFRKCSPEYALMYRLPDSAQAFGGGNLRFSSKNPFDYILWDSKRRNLYALELKTVAEDSISFERDKGETGTIHWHQIQGLKKWREFGIIAGFVIEFRKSAKTIFIGIDDFLELIEKVEKKSFNLADLEKFAAKYIVIEQVKKRTNYSYDIDGFLSAQDCV